ncbi:MULTISPECIES: type III secretion system export apparatus subunit SctV [unclassified Variovorax]|uniref:type III secretion system export apparatus subunit SctV n=1 Tax=unclassified Variovorax TaxID=663243 RepID=UPI00076D34CC|nr:MULTISPECIES: type III secretion system export apparatus subunit SctV [unclassified Variovorax]KWT98723.1 Type III secretion inner membrane channel protein (LcrD,HrcV,EscV,SsaV) [Variovorax sp. WDL1]PNG56213.1 Secretion system apparatus protein SsaV [Variovorax sp. B4]PNG57637.1 Secretion system apparatus protein SsaV [Variovorax sp. B2]VTV09945.1 Secretion system apparatus protein SsaV [Variovorax sp. WDL1]
MASPARSLPPYRGSLRDLFANAGRYCDLLLAGLLVVVVALFVLPLPTPLLDLLIASNLAISLVLLIVAMYVPSALSLSTFPSLLLFTTLFRLALNIASTKLILLQANAGHIIDTFGKLIVGNNVVVGGVVFLIIAIVQFIVIAKGSERVAEVAARFALDAMPGKQMSIDADVRAGVLSSAQAQKRRQVLEQECQLHGAMDGAMKFVKGDAIASIVIALVNILAGIAIGTLMHEMTLAGALQRFAILTVGDGMVSQIPSLLVSIAAGIVITRVGSGERRDAQLASQIGEQLMAHPRALVIAGIAVASFLVVPGFPKWVFGLLAALIIGLGFAMRRVRARRRTPGWISHREAIDEEEGESAHAIASPLAVRLSDTLRGAVDRHALDQELSGVKTAVESDLGPVFPRLQLAYAAGLPEHGYQVLVHDVVVSEGLLQPGWQLLDPAEATTPPAGAQVAEPFGPFARVVWVQGAQPGLRTWEAHEVVGLHVDHAVRRNVRELIGLQEVQRLLHSVQRDAPELSAEVARVASPQRIAEVLRRLLQEGIPIRNLHAIFECLAIWAPKEQDSIALTELVRIHLGRYITSRYVGSSRQLEAILFESSLLERVQNAVERSPRGNLLLLSPAVAQDIREQVRRILGSTANRVVAIASSDVRRYVKTLIEPVAPTLPVLSYQEVDEDVALQPVGWVTNPQAH